MDNISGVLAVVVLVASISILVIVFDELRRR